MCLLLRTPCSPCHNPQPQPLSREGSVLVRVSSSEGGSPAHSRAGRVVVRVSNAGGSPSPCVSLGGALTSSSDDLPSNSGQWACRQPGPLAPTYDEFAAEFMAKHEAMRAGSCNSSSSSCGSGSGSVGEAGVVRPADAHSRRAGRHYLESDQGVHGVKELRAGMGLGDRRHTAGCQATASARPLAMLPLWQQLLLCCCHRISHRPN